MQFVRVTDDNYVQIAEFFGVNDFEAQFEYFGKRLMAEPEYLIEVETTGKRLQKAYFEPLQAATRARFEEMMDRTRLPDYTDQITFAETD